MCPPFKNGTNTNVHVKGKKLCHLRIKAGPQRDEYVHTLIFKAKILGRREAFEKLCPGIPVPEDDFYRYIDPTFETIDHDDNDSLNNEPSNLVRMTRADNSIKANKHRAKQRKEKLSTTDTDFP